MAADFLTIRGRPQMDTDAESLIAHLAGALNPKDRADFRRAAEAALQNEPPYGWGPGSVHRAIATVWRDFFHPPFTREAPWSSGHRNQSKLIHDGPQDYSRRRERA